MNFNILMICITWLITFVAILLFVNFKILPIKNRKYEIKEKEAKNKQYELYSSLDAKAMQTAIDEYFESYINRYIVYKFMSKKVMYIKQEDVTQMVRDITTSITLEISELYIFYIRMIRVINSDDDLIEYIHNKVMNTCVEDVMNYNKQMV